MSHKPRVGDVYRIPVVFSTDFTSLADVDLTVTGVTRDGCGCTRLSAVRPGPENPVFGRVAFTVDRCDFHRANPGPEGEEAVWVHDHSWQPVPKYVGFYRCDCGEIRIEEAG